VETKTQTKESSTSVIDQKNLLKLILVSVSMMAMENNWYTYVLLLWGTMRGNSDLLNSLINGTLVIEVRMRPLIFSTALHSRKSVSVQNHQGLFLSDKSADIVFEVGEEEQSKDNSMKIAKTSPVTFSAQRLIVANCSSILAELCESNGDDRTTPIQVTGVTPDVFRHILFYMYGGKISDDGMTTHAKEIIDVADRYGVTSLKLEADVCLVNATIFGVENLKDVLLYADSKNCA
jgi:hypothetical protein